MIQALCWTLIHSLWQGLIFGVITGVVMLCTKRTAASLRYAVVSCLFCLFLVSCLCTFGWEWKIRMQEHDVWAYLASMAGGGGASRMKVMTDWMKVVTDYLSAHASSIVILWCLLLAARSVRMLSGVRYMRRVRRERTVAPPAYWSDKIISLCNRAGVRRTVQLLESRMAKMPMVIGHLRPVILIPLGLLTRLPEGEIEAVLLHELAHIRRNDYLINLLQHIAENLFFFNPGMMWMSAILREERENCCDDVAIAETKDKAQFIQALINFKEYALQTPAYAPAFPAKKNQLLSRTMRIIQDRNKTLNPVEKMFVAGSCIALLCLFMAWPGNSLRPFAREDSDMEAHGQRYAVLAEIQDNGAWQGASENKVMTRITQMGGGTMIADDNTVSDDGRRGETATLDAIASDTGASDKGASEAAFPETDVKLAAASEADGVMMKDGVMMNGSDPASEEQRAKAEEREDAERLKIEQEQAKQDKRQAELDALQAKRDALQAEKDAQMAQLDAQQARLDAQQAQKDQELAKKDQAQAKQDLGQAIKEKTKEQELTRKETVNASGEREVTVQVKHTVLVKRDMERATTNYH